MTLETSAEPGNPRSLVERLDAATSQPVQPRRVRGSGVELRVGIVLWPGFPLLSLAGLCDGLRHAADLGDQSRQRRCSWTIFGVPGASVAASCGVGIPVESPMEDAEGCDYVAVDRKSVV